MANKSFTAVLRLGSVASLAKDGDEESGKHMQLCNDLVGAVKNLPAKALNRFQFFRLELIGPEDLFQAAEEALQEKRQKVEDEIRVKSQEIREARLTDDERTVG